MAPPMGLGLNKIVKKEEEKMNRFVASNISSSSSKVLLHS